MKTILLRCDGGLEPEIGTGHVMRMIHLGNHLKKTISKDIVFVTKRDKQFSVGYNLIKKNNFKTLDVPDAYLKHNSSKEAEILSKTKNVLIIIDRLNVGKKFMEIIKRDRKKVLVFDSLGLGNSRANLVINTIVKGEKKGKNIITGYKYCFLDQKIKKFSNYIYNKKKNLTVTLGGYDYKKNSLKILSIIPYLEKFKKVNFISGNKKDFNILKKKISKFKKIKLYYRPKNILKILFDSKLVIVSGGITLFECILMNIPTVALPQYNHQLKTIRNLSKYKLTILGSNKMGILRKKLINKIIYSNLKDYKFSNKKLFSLDCNGLKRISQYISKIIDGKI